MGWLAGQVLEPQWLRAVSPSWLLGEKQRALGVRTFWVFSKLRMPQSNTRLREGCLVTVPLLSSGNVCYTGLDFLSCWGSLGISTINESKQLPAFHAVVQGFPGLSWTVVFWTSVFLVLLVNPWTQTLQSRAAFIRLALLVSNSLFQVYLITLSKSSTCG